MIHLAKGGGTFDPLRRGVAANHDDDPIGSLKGRIPCRPAGEPVEVEALVAMVDFVEMLRRSATIKDVSALFVAKITFYRVPYLTERAMPFAVMAGAMYCYLNLSRRLELVIARSAGVSAWQFVAPAVFFALVIGIASTGLYNPVSATLREESNRLEAELFGRNLRIENTGGSYWIRQRTDEGQAIINAKSRAQRGAWLARTMVLSNASKRKVPRSIRVFGRSTTPEFTEVRPRRSIRPHSDSKPL